MVLGVLRNFPNSYAVVTLFGGDQVQLWYLSHVFCTRPMSCFWGLSEQFHMQWWRFSRLVVCAILTTLSPNLQAFSCRVTVSFQFWNNQLSSGIKYQRKAYLIVYSSWQWTNKLTFIKTFQNTAGLIWCVQYAVQTFDKCISFVEKQVWPDHVMCFRECFCKLPPPQWKNKKYSFPSGPRKVQSVIQ